MKQLAIVAGALAILAMPSCFLLNDDEVCVNGRGDRVTELLAIPDFTGIELNIAADVYIVQGPAQKIEVEAQQNIIDLLKRDVRDDVWRIEFDRCTFDYSLVEITITVPDLNLIRINSSGDINGLGQFLANDMELVLTGSGDLQLDLVAGKVNTRISGSGDLELDVEANELDATISGSGDFRAAGQTQDLNVLTSGSGDFKGYELEAKNAALKISGSGDIQCLVTDNMDVTITGSGSVHYKGFPVINVTITGSGDLVNEN
ncbi:MAG: DUF2807 domain-containing protein [Saprospirales bacterium]|nr:DUF2807 domain-containing protein [Saprospirales bacterium]